MKQITFNGISIQMVEAFSETAFDLTLFTFFFWMNTGFSTANESQSSSSPSSVRRSTQA